MIEAVGPTCPEVIAIVDYEYIGDRLKWLEKLSQLNELPRDSALCVQVRVKSVQANALLELAQAARDAFRNDGVRLCWNGTPQVAKQFGFDACHMPEAELRKCGDVSECGFPASASIHSVTALKVAEAIKLNYVIFGPVYQPSWKEAESQGLRRLASLTEAASIPVVAIGGINLETLGDIKGTGTSGVACLSAVLEADEPVQTVLAIQSSWHCGSLSTETNAS